MACRLAARPLLAAGLALWLAACASHAPPHAGNGSLGTTAPAPGARVATPPAGGPLAGELRWMRQLFDGTPVQVEAESDGALRVEVPMAYAFDANASTPRAPLKAVLDKLALSLYRQPSAQVHLGPPGPAARERLAAMRSYLGNKGVVPQRMLAAAPSQSDMVLLRVAPPPGAVERLDDESPPAQPAMAAPRAAFKPPANR